MRTFLAAIVLAGAVCGCDAKGTSSLPSSPPAPPAPQKNVEAPSVAATVKIDDV